MCLWAQPDDRQRQRRFTEGDARTNLQHLWRWEGKEKKSREEAVEKDYPMVDGEEGGGWQLSIR